MNPKAIPNERWLFIGDSITDYRRRTDPEGLGFGYVRMLNQWLFGRGYAPEAVINRGISGQTIRNLSERWESDVLLLKPDLLSIMIGVNDVGYIYNENRSYDGVSIDEFIQTYEHCLMLVNKVLPRCRIVLCEPCGVFPPRASEISKALGPYLDAVNVLVNKYSEFPVVPLHAAFVNAIANKPEVDWTVDGIHPSPIGDALIAETWMRTVGLIR